MSYIPEGKRFWSAEQRASVLSTAKDGYGDGETYVTFSPREAIAAVETVAELVKALEDARTIINDVSKFVPTTFDTKMIRWDVETAALLDEVTR